MPALVKNRSRQGNPWTLKEFKQLGKIPDSVLAKRTGRTIKEVVAMREQRRIGLQSPPRRWTASETKLLGTMSDRELGRRLRRTFGTVRMQRVAFNIPPFTAGPKFKFWKPAELRLLGTMPDSELSRKLGRTLSSVQSQRYLLRPTYAQPRFKAWSRAEDKLLGVKPDEEVARLLQRGIHGVRLQDNAFGLAAAIGGASEETQENLSLAEDLFDWSHSVLPENISDAEDGFNFPEFSTSGLQVGNDISGMSAGQSGCQ